GYLIHCLDKLSREFEISSSHYQQDEAEVESMKKEVQRLQTSGKAAIRQTSHLSTKCFYCHMPACTSTPSLDVVTIYFDQPVQRHTSM
ncbi:hypothetical protein TGRUB_429960, partial [Toxoplasma gondii RUB]